MTQRLEASHPGSRWYRLLRLVAFLLAVMLPRDLRAADTGFLPATNVVSTGTWTTFTVGQLNTSDDARATVAASGSNGVLNNFGFVIPGGATISGIEVEVEGSDGTAGQTVNFGIDLSWNNGANWTSWPLFVPPSPEPGSFTGTTDSTFIFGSGSLWGRTWTPAELSNANFRLRIYRTGGTGDLRVDRLRVRVSFYTLPWPAGSMQYKSGTYLGDGTSARAITGLGFQPDVVIVIADNTCHGIAPSVCGRDSVIRTSTMGPSDIVGGGYGLGGYAPMRNRIRSLDADGFTVGEPPNHAAPNDNPGMPIHCVNHSGTRYYWTAFKAAAGELEIGTYDGDAAASRDITTLSFQPDYVMITSTEGERILHRTSGMPVDTSFDIEGGAYCPTCGFTPAIRTMLANGFRIGPFVNANLSTFHYVAWKALPGRMAVGQYTGNGADNRSITGTGFRPDHVMVKQGTPLPPNSAAMVKTGAMGAATDLSFPHIDYDNAPPAFPVTDGIQALEANGFQVGTNPGINANGQTYYWVAFGPGTSPTRVLSGSYIGNGVDNRAITGLGFPPDFVLVKRDDASYSVVSTSSMGGLTKPVTNGGSAAFAGGIKTLDAGGFTLGTNPLVNAAGVSYYWVAFEAGAGEMTVGSYGGTGPDNRPVTGVGFQPDYVMVLPQGALEPAQRTSTMPVDASYNFDAAGPLTDRIQLMQADGFEAGGFLNQGGQTYHYVAWKAVAGRMAVGQYTGDGADPRYVNTAGFFPEWALVKRTDNTRPWMHKPASTGVDADYSLYLSNFAGTTNEIQRLRPLGFDVGSGPRTNQSPIVYYWAAFGPHTETYVRSIGANGVAYTTGQVTVTKGSTAVTGIGGTTWVTANRGRGDRITITGQGTYVIQAVTSNTQLILTTPFVGTAGSYNYSIGRQFTTLAAWEDCVDGPPGTACPFFPVTSASLVADNRSEVGIAYDDATPSFLLGSNFVIQDATTDATHTILLTADPPNRHNGVPGAGVVVDANLGGNEFDIRDSNVTVEWLELVRARGDNVAAIQVWSTDGDLAQNVVLQNLLIHDFGDKIVGGFNSGGIDLAGNNTLVGKSMIVRNTMIWDGDQQAIEGDGTLDTALIENVSVDGMKERGIYASQGPFTVRNTIVTGSPSGDFVPGTGGLSGSHNTSTDGTAATYFASPLTGVTAASIFVAPNANLHLLAGANSQVNSGTDLPTFAKDIDGQSRPTGGWDRGADERDATTEVTLASFEATGIESAVALRWQTASELQNLGFHLYRSESAGGPYTRITSWLIPGLGSSPTGQSYSYDDVGLVNGRTYFYELEDVETTGQTERHGPVSATPTAPSGGSDPPEPSGPSETSYGDPSFVVLREVERSDRHVVLELRTGGFWASPAEEGRVRLRIPGFESVSRPGEPKLPMRRAFVEAAAGRSVHLTSVVASDELRFPGLRPVPQGAPGIEASEDGTVTTSEKARPEGPAFSRTFPSEPALLPGTSFQGETKKAEVLLFPLRWEGSGLTLSRRLRVRLEFSGREAGETSRGGSSGRRPVERASHRPTGLLVQMVVKEKGLHRVSFEDVFGTDGGRRPRGLSPSSLRLSRQGKSVAFHVEPPGAPFGPGSSLYFLSEGSSLNPYGDAVFELEADTTGRGLRMEVEGMIPSTSRTVTEYFPSLSREENHYYQAGLLEAPDLWLWDVAVSPGTKSFGFTVSDVSLSPSTGRLVVEMQGASDFPGVLDHHVRVGVNGIFLGETTWDGPTPKSLEVELEPGVLHEGTNTLELEDVGDTGAAYSMVFLNRFEVSYPRRLVATDGRLEGRFETSGPAEIEGASPSSFVLDTTDVPKWVVGASASAGGLTLSVTAGRSYYLTPTALRPEVRRPLASGLKSPTNRADYLLLGPRAFLGVAQPLLDLRESQGLVTKAVSLEEVYEQFGYGEASPFAIKEFLEYAYHFWAAPSPRYVLLLGDASYDPKDYLGTGTKDWLPGYPVETSYLWTVSDAAYASVNGEDLLPDVAIGRLPAGSVDEAQRLVGKVLGYENGGGTLEGSAVLVADNPDLAGNFEADADEIASTVLASRRPTKIYYSQLGGATRDAIMDAFDHGPSLMSYVGHGGTAAWASELFFRRQDVAALSLQPQQPMLLTMNCLNGFFHFPPMNSLSEELLKAEGKGVVGAFSPSGLSVNDPAHLLHGVLLEEIVSARHERIGDAMLAAQARYSAGGGFPELLSIYHLLGDPALRIR